MSPVYRIGLALQKCKVILLWLVFRIFTEGVQVEGYNAVKQNLHGGTLMEHLFSHQAWQDPIGLKESFVIQRFEQLFHQEFD